MPQEAVEIGAAGVCGERGVEAGAQPVEGRRVMAGEAQRRGQVVIDGLDDPSDAIAPLRNRRRQRGALVAAGHGEQCHGVFLAQFVRQRGADVALVAAADHVMLLTQQFGPDRHSAGTRRGQQVQRVAAARLLLGRHLAEIGPCGPP